MPGKYNFVHMRKYPHMIGEDTDVWNRFIIKFPNRFDTVDYDVHIGKGVNTSPILNKSDQKYWAQLTRKRIDVIGYKDSLITIIEVKKRATLFTLGQVLGYRFLYLSEHPEQKGVLTLLLCSKVDQDDLSVLLHYAIDVLVI